MYNTDKPHEGNNTDRYTKKGVLYGRTRIGKAEEKERETAVC